MAQKSKAEFVAAIEKPVSNFTPTKKDPNIQFNGDNIVDQIISHSEEDFLPWEEIQLPSLGLYYGEALPEGKLQVRPMGITAEKILATQRLAATGRSIDLMLKKCVKFPANFGPDDLLLGDKNFLFFYIRGITYGPEYNFLYTCSDKQCGRASEYEGTLHDVRIRFANPELGIEPFKIELPVLSASTKKKVWAKAKMLRSKESREMMNQISTSRRYEDLDAMIDETISSNIARLIVEVGTDESSTADREKIQKFVERLHSNDAKIIDKFVEDASPGIETKVKLTCMHCGNEMTGELPITESFFRPSK